jgi:hypothetical protein
MAQRTKNGDRDLAPSRGHEVACAILRQAKRYIPDVRRGVMGKSWDWGVGERQIEQ